MGRLRNIISNIEFVLAAISNILTWIALYQDHPSENTVECWFNALSMLLSSASSFWPTLGVQDYRWRADIDFIKMVYGIVASVGVVSIDIIMYHEKGHWVIGIPLVLVELIPFLPQIFKIKNTASYFPLIPKYINLASVMFSIVGSMFSTDWKLIDAYNQFLGAAYTLCWLVGSNGTHELVLVYLNALVRVIYGFYILVRCIGARPIWEWIQKVWSYFWRLVKSVWAGMKMVWSCFLSFVKSVWAGMKMVWGCFWSFGKSVWAGMKMVWGCCLSLGKSAWARMKAAGSYCWEGMKPVLSYLISYCYDGWGTVSRELGF